MENKDHILLHYNRPAWLKLNSTAADIAECLDRNEPVKDIANRLVQTYGITFQAASEDVLSIQSQLNQLNFLTKTVPPTRSPKPQSVFFHLTTRCNLNCPHCYAGIGCDPPCNKRGEVNKDIPASIVCDLTDEMADNNGQFITLSGGEPLVHPEFKKIVQHTSRKTGIQILTNGTLINREWADFFGDKNISVQISLDGSEKKIHDAVRGRGSFDKAVRAVEYLQKAGLGKRLSFCTTIMNQNLHDLHRIISLTEKLGVRKLRFLPLRKIGSAEKEWNSISGTNIKEYERFFRQISDLQKNTGFDLTCGLSGFLLNIPKEISDDEIWCPVGKKLVVDTDGAVYPCVLMMHDEFRIGNVFSESLTQLIQSEKMAMICDALATRRNKIEKCSGCHWRNFCQGGCMGQALDHKGTIWDVDDFCEYRKKVYKEAFDRILR
ncbi:MAG: radical SAM protein [Desulfobacteraceae bacterium]|nr:radical SAM protein [Desulfobacteraceae bacterium]